MNSHQSDGLALLDCSGHAGEMAKKQHQRNGWSMTSRLIALTSLLLLATACSSNVGPDEVTGSASQVGPQSGEGGITSGSASDLRSSELGAPEPGTAQDFEVNVGDRVFFDNDSSTINDEGRETLDRQAAWLNQYPSISVTIEGHTDERGTREYNLALGDRRANAAKNYLVALGVSAERLLTLSYGEERPVDPGVGEAAWAQNRRAVTVVNLVN